MESLSASESIFEVATTAAALAVVLWSMRQSMRRSPESPATGEIVWTIVAALVLLATVTAVRLGAGHVV